MEEAESVRLHDLSAVNGLPQQGGCRWNSNGQDGIASLGRSQQVANGADAADARGDAGHLVIRPAFGELFEASHLRDVKVRALNAAVRAQVDGDLGVPLDAGNRIDDYFSHASLLAEFHF